MGFNSGFKGLNKTHSEDDGLRVKTCNWLVINRNID